MEFFPADDPVRIGGKVLYNLCLSPGNFYLLFFAFYFQGRNIDIQICKLKGLPNRPGGVGASQHRTYPSQQLFEAIRTVSTGGSLLQPVVASKLIEHVSGESEQKKGEGIIPLTERERQVLEQLALGKTNKEIALELVISERTVKFHVSSIFSKLGAGNRTEAVTIAARDGLVTLNKNLPN